MSHPQPITQLLIEDTTYVGIFNDIIKQHKSRLMNMQYFWICDTKILNFFLLHESLDKKILPTIL